MTEMPIQLEACPRCNAITDMSHHSVLACEARLKDWAEHLVRMRDIEQTYYGPTPWDSDPGKEWHHTCQGEVFSHEDGYRSCQKCQKEWAPENQESVQEADVFDTNPVVVVREQKPIERFNAAIAPFVKDWPDPEEKEKGWPDAEPKEKEQSDAPKEDDRPAVVTTSSDLRVELIDSMGDDMRVVQTAKVSTAGELALEDVESTDVERFVNFLMRDRHGSPFEHNSFTFFVKAPIAVFREFHRHRIGFSYNEESGRYKKLKPDFYIPPVHRPLTQTGKPGAYTYEAGTAEQHKELTATLLDHFNDSYRRYEALLSAGVAKEVARGVLPVYLYSSMFVTCNARSIMNLLSLRTRHEDSKYPSFPMWEIEQVAWQIGTLWATKMPVTAQLFRKHGSVAP